MAYKESKKKYYVTMTDRFMSGWGGAKGKINKLIIECDTYAQAEIIARNAEQRSEMSYINIVTKYPYYNSKKYKVSDKTYDELGTIWKK
jgi:hypothetical protein